MKKSKVLAMALGLAMGVSASTALAAEAQDGAALSETAFNDVPQGHWAYSALEVLSKDGVLEGYPDGSFKGNETMTRYEMAQIIANAYKGGSFADDALIDGVRQELSGELKTLKKVEKQVKKNTAAINKMQSFVDKLELSGMGQVRYENSGDHGYDDLNANDRYYVSLKTNYKVNDNWKVCTEWEINHKYGNYRTFNRRGTNIPQTSENTGPEGPGAGKTPYYVGGGRGDSKIYPRIWFEGQLSKKLSMEIGRKWRGMGFQNVAFGEDTDGFTFNYKPNDSDLTLSAYYWKPDKKDVNQLALAGLALKGTVGHGTQLQLNYARANVEKDGSTVVGYNEYYDLKPVTWAYGNQMIGISMLRDLAPNLYLWADYSRTNADEQNNATALKVSYKWTDLNQPGSFHLYGRWHNYKDNGRWLGDTADSLWLDGSTGWTFGGKYVFAKNVEGELCYGWSKATHSSVPGEDSYTRRIIRGQVDFHF
ncbi:MAG: S-layer homology domain-containing protein [Anaerovibrio sp.]|nr:S-layer homology domain-containing protein [Anaerovibrio sp.]